MHKVSLHNRLLPGAGKILDRIKYFLVAVVTCVIVILIARFTVFAHDSTSVVTLDFGLIPGTASGYLLGPASAPLEIIEFADFECEGCATWSKKMGRMLRDRSIETGMLSFSFYDFPLVSTHSNALSAHVAAGCAQEQNKFWQMHDVLYDRLDEWKTSRTNNPKKYFRLYAKNVGLNIGAWTDCYDKRRPLPQILANMRKGDIFNVVSVPAIRIGDKSVPVGEIFSYDRIRAYVDSALSEVVLNKSRKDK